MHIIYYSAADPDTALLGTDQYRPLDGRLGLERSITEARRSPPPKARYFQIQHGARPYSGPPVNFFFKRLTESGAIHPAHYAVVYDTLEGMAAELHDEISLLEKQQAELHDEIAALKEQLRDCGED